MAWSKDPNSTDWHMEYFSDDEMLDVGETGDVEETQDEDPKCIDSDETDASPTNAIALSTNINTTSTSPMVIHPPPNHTRLLYITELSQAIFANRSFRDRITCTSVCQRWRKILLCEMPTAFEMFMKARQQPSFTWLTMCRKGLSWEETTQWRQQWHNNLNKPIQCEKLRCVRLRPHRAVDESRVNPLFLELCVTDDTCLRINGHCATFVFVTAEAVAKFLDLHRTSAKDAVWRKMFLTNPPVRKFGAYSNLRGDVVEDDDGVRLGEVAKYLAEIVAREEENDTLRRECSRWRR